ncbi:hypothetical protein ANASTE_01008 [Anaerofustis stercorihominis DSM 17244]|uniref:Uncharacterized protein n=1 Tax=Anaerofustis stercorihominis DSM 17244 TaxID=445971 RepID=B1C8F1_9FIRM|nr:hypothetical protein ANASTE_01008 [Anaerofustis stercorihominis DSM 17244]
MKIVKNDKWKLIFVSVNQMKSISKILLVQVLGIILTVDFY